ncbi:MAG TPA: extracellular solute-binding protein [Acidimicrobiales bacterium]
MRLHSSRFRGLLGAAAGASLTLTTIALVPAGASTTTNVSVVGYSVAGPVTKALETAFQKTPAGQSVTFTNSFGASDTETNNVVNGQSADLVNLSYEPNIATLVTAGKVPVNWARQELTYGRVNPALQGKRQQTVYPTPGIVTDSVVVFVVRPNNPLHIATWGDLIKSGVQLVTPNPLTSGSAKWNLLAGYTSQLSLKRTPTQAQNYLKSLLANTVAQPTSGSAALSTFLAGTGNVLLAYEDDALAANAAGDAIEIVTPPQTLLIENPVALTQTGVANPAATAFYQYLFSTRGQSIYSSFGYRSVLKSVWTHNQNAFPSFKKASYLWTIAKIAKGGWTSVDPTFFGTSIVFPSNDATHPSSGIVTYLEQFAGKNT